LADAYSVKAKYEMTLLKTKGVIGVGALPDKIIVYVESEEVSVPATLDGIPVEKKVIGKVGLL